MNKRWQKLKMILTVPAILLPTIFGVVCVKLHLIPVNASDGQIYGTALLPEQLMAIQGRQLFEMALLCAMITITGILAVIALTRRLSHRQRETN
jgi:hypothetical protein